jgi:hypothetical protein
LEVIARPGSDTLIAEPKEYFGKVTIGNLVFPRYGKSGGARFPGPQNVDPELWRELQQKSRSGDWK